MRLIGLAFLLTVSLFAIPQTILLLADEIIQ
jgi:hypothetical protein